MTMNMNMNMDMETQATVDRYKLAYYFLGYGSDDNKKTTEINSTMISNISAVVAFLEDLENGSGSYAEIVSKMAKDTTYFMTVIKFLDLVDGGNNNNKLKYQPSEDKAMVAMIQMAERMELPNHDILTVAKKRRRKLGRSQ